jgi:hypothetical protein
VYGLPFQWLSLLYGFSLIAYWNKNSRPRTEITVIAVSARCCKLLDRHGSQQDTNMIDPYFLKSLGFSVLIVGLIGDFIALFVPASRRALEKTLGVVSILLIIAGVATERFAEHIIDTGNGPRHISPVEGSALSDDMHAFAGEEFTILNYTDEVEATELTDAVKAALDKAGWRYSPPKFGEQLLNTGLTGVLIRINIASDEKTTDAAKALETGLNKKSIVSRVWPVSDVQKNRIAIHIFTRLRPY